MKKKIVLKKHHSIHFFEATTTAELSSGGDIFTFTLLNVIRNGQRATHFYLNHRVISKTFFSR